MKLTKVKNKKKTPLLLKKARVKPTKHNPKRKHRTRRRAKGSSSTSASVFGSASATASAAAGRRCFGE